MQWSLGHNARFSDADPADLYCPVIDDETYGYQRVNVEAQRTDPSSLLNLTREMIRIRKAHPALGRGSLRFLEGQNPAVLAYLRQHGDETILAIGNLSAQVQGVDLDLSEFAGTQPVDLFTQEKLAPAKAQPYRLELGRYQYRWLQL
jgi:maltose alpha-D-glucosyltransferase/alpha-amylase